MPVSLTWLAAESRGIGAAIEAEIPAHLLYTKGWPTCMPTRDEARVIARVRRAVGELLDIDVLYTDAGAVEARYAELMRDQAAAQRPVQLEMILA